MYGLPLIRNPQNLKFVTFACRSVTSDRNLSLKTNRANYPEIFFLYYRTDFLLSSEYYVEIRHFRELVLYVWVEVI